ncbi:MAG: DNA helicase II / ATP-dependent DNA helicase PcrA [Parcubacteria group bacterium Gr01-1014_19]|nr:MAG: DNA helicase II / ATP-dependent DNA helicase PcrA [Parcubacteria group bacterium Gr01-1014_19]
MSASFKGLNEPQQEAVEYDGGPILIAAGAGSGKTKTLTSRLARLIEKGVAPSKIVAITFTNKAANEMRERVAKQLATSGATPFLGTFHSFCARILKDEARLAGRTPNFSIYDADDSLSLIKKIMKAADISKDVISPAVLQNKISQIKSEMLSPEDFDKITKKIYEKYEAALADSNAFDFDDLITKVVQIFDGHPEVLKKYHEKYSHILVDEYQDINSSQYKLIRFLAEQQKNLSVVGDDQQAIYSFRGADFRNFLNFKNDWPEAKIVKLEQNYRSSGTIIDAASAVVQNNKLQTPKKLWTENAAGEKIKIIRAASREEEAMLIASQIKQIREGNVAVLYRTNAQSRAIEQSLLSANVPYRIFGGIKFYERKEVKDLLAGLRLAYNPADAVSEERIGKTFDRKTAAYLIQELPRLGEKLNQLELINFFMENANYVDYLQKEYKNFSERLENINELISFASQFKTLGEFLEKVSLLQSADAPSQSLVVSRKSLVHLRDTGTPIRLRRFSHRKIQAPR